MVFWGAEVKPGKPYFHTDFGEYEGCRLHLSQATLGLDAKKKERTVIKCKVGDGAELLLCSLTAGVVESCSLDLLFDQDVVFSVTGPSSVHLVGYYMPLDAEEDDDDEDYSILGSESEEESDSDFDVDDALDDSDEYDVVRGSSVKIAEVDDDGNPLAQAAMGIGHMGMHTDMPARENQRNLQLTFSAAYSVQDCDEDSEGYEPTSPVYVPEMGGTEGDREDIYLQSSPSIEVKEGRKPRGRKTVVSVAREETTTVATVPEKPTKVAEGREESEKGSKKRKKQAAKSTKENGTAQAANASEVSEDEDGFPLPSKRQQHANGADKVDSDGKQKMDKKKGKEMEKLEKDKQRSEKEKKKEKLKEKRQKKKLKRKEKGTEGSEKVGEEIVETDAQPAEDGTELETGNASPLAEKEKRGKKANVGVRKYPNGLQVADVAYGKPDAKQTKSGKSLSVYYTGRVQSSGKIFDSNIGLRPFKFRLGVGEVIKGWDVGVSGMRVGDKRRITIPPAMGYGSRGVAGKIPGNSWLVFDVELVSAAG